MSKTFTKKLEKYMSKQGRQLPKETRSVLNKKPAELTPQESQWFTQNVEPYLGFISSTLEAIYLQEREPDSWAKELAHDRGFTILEQMAYEIVAANRPPELQVDEQEEAIEGEIVSDGDTLNVKPGTIDDAAKVEREEMPEGGGVPEEDGVSEKVVSQEDAGKREGEPQVGMAAEEDESELGGDRESSEEEPAETVLQSASTETILLKDKEAEENDHRENEGALIPVPPTVMLQPGERDMQEYGLVQASHVPGVAQTEITAVAPEMAPFDLQAGKTEKPASWLKQHKILVLICAIGVIVAGAATFLTMFFLIGRRQVLYEWSRSDRIGNDLRIERALTMEKGVGESSFRFTVDLKIENLGKEQLAVLQIEEQLPDILSKKGEFVFLPEYEEGKRNGNIVAWEEEKVGRDESFEVSYYLPLEAELSKPQLEEIEEHFGSVIIAFVGLPENHAQCADCEGMGNMTCQGCAGAGSSVCTACGGGGSTTCSSCGGSGRGRCNICQGDGYFYQCPNDGAIVNGYYDNCPRCGASWRYMPEKTCYNCGGSGIASCSVCGGSGRAKCGQCGGSGRLVCAACAGSGKVTCPACQGSGQVAFAFGESKIFAGQ